MHPSLPKFQPANPTRMHASRSPNPPSSPKKNPQRTTASKPSRHIIAMRQSQHSTPDAHNHLGNHDTYPLCSPRPRVSTSRQIQIAVTQLSSRRDPQRQPQRPRHPSHHHRRGRGRRRRKTHRCRLDGHAEIDGRRGRRRRGRGVVADGVAWEEDGWCGGSLGTVCMNEKRKGT